MKNTVSGLIIVSAITFSGVTFADDLSGYSNDELFGMKNQFRTMDDAAKNAYREERQNRMMNMNQAEKDSRFGDMGASGKKNMERMKQKNRSGNGKHQGKGKGQGQGKQSNSGNQYRYGQANDNGSGNQYRYGQANDSGSGSQNRYGQGGGKRYGGGR